MNVSVWTTAQLQNALALVSVAIDAGLDIHNLRELLASYGMQAPGEVGTRQPDTLCPQCGQRTGSVLRRWPGSSRQAGVPIVGCVVCQYSRMVER